MADSVPPLLPRSTTPPGIVAAPLPPLLSEVKAASKTLWVYRCWCWLFVLLYLTFCANYVQVARGEVEPSLGLMETVLGRMNPSVGEEIVAEKRARAPEMAIVTALVAFLYGTAAAIPRKPWTWTFGLVMICSMILPFVITAAVAIPLLLSWLKPAMKSMFGRQH